MIKSLVLFSIAVLYTSCHSETNNAYEGYSEVEIETEKCLDAWLERNDVDWKELSFIFEDYFASANMTDTADPKAKQYADILHGFHSPSGPYLPFKSKKEVLAIMDKLHLSDKDVIQKNQLDCFTNTFIDHEDELDTASTYYAFGATLEMMEMIPDISPAIIAGALDAEIDKADLSKTLYQKTIVLMYCFEMAIFLPAEAGNK